MIQTAHKRHSRALFLCPASVYGGWCGAGFGLAGVRLSRFVTPVSVATNPRRDKRLGGSKALKRSLTMTTPTTGENRPKPAHTPVYRIPVEVPVYLAGIQSNLNHVQELVPPGSLLWLYAHVAKRAVRLSLEVLDQPPAARLYVCAKPRARFLEHLDEAADRALSIAARVIDDLFVNMARASAYRTAQELYAEGRAMVATGQDRKNHIREVVSQAVAAALEGIEENGFSPEARTIGHQGDNGHDR
jgi:hypothetical protein